MFVNLLIIVFGRKTGLLSEAAANILLAKFLMKCCERKLDAWNAENLRMTVGAVLWILHIQFVA